MTNEHKQKISQANLGKTRNNGKIWVTNGFETTRILPSDFGLWEAKGYVRGKKLLNRPQTAWNKGLKAADDPRVARQRRVTKKKVND